MLRLFLLLLCLAQPRPSVRMDVPVSDGFDYPVGTKGYYTEANDGDGWYNLNNFGHKKHLGEDWNKEGGNDCGEPVYAASAGLVIYSAMSHKTWGNVIVIRHKLPNGEQVETLYAHVQTAGMIPYLSKVKRHQQIAIIGDGADPCGDGKPYGAHLHFEIHLPTYRYWGGVGSGYSTDTHGLVDPSNYLDAHRHL